MRLKRSGQSKLIPVPTFFYLAKMMPPEKQTRMDGDTWWMDIDVGLRVSVQTKIRMKDYSTPEKTEPGGPAAKARALQLLYAAKVIVVQTHKAYEQDRPIYDRWEGALWLDGVHLGEKLFQEGIATYTPM